MPIKEENLLPYDGKLKAGQRLIRLGNTFIPIGIGGNFQPYNVNYQQQGRDDFYICYQVLDQSWKGYKLIFNEEEYIISYDDSIELNYGNGFIPKKNKIYNIDTTIELQCQLKLQIQE